MKSGNLSLRTIKSTCAYNTCSLECIKGIWKRIHRNRKKIVKTFEQDNFKFSRVLIGMTAKGAAIWDYFNKEIENTEIEDKNTYNGSKKCRMIDIKSKTQDSVWLKSLLNPSMEQSFKRFEVKSIISLTETHLICTITPNFDLFPEFNTLVGCFDIWWWRRILLRAEFSVLEDISKNFLFLKQT